MIHYKKPIFWQFIVIVLLNSTALGSSIDSSFYKYIFPEDAKINYLEPTSNIHRGFPIFRRTNTEVPNVQILNDFFYKSFAIQSLKHYFLAQNYLLNTGQISQIEPVYLLLSDNKGGYSKKGFYILNEGKSRINKTGFYYIGYSKENDNSENSLNSFTKIFSREMGNIIYFLLTNNNNIELPATQNIHFSSIITDYRTAFNEGFAIHNESIALENEANVQVKNNIINEANKKNININRFVGGYLRDFYFPIRLDYYRVTPILWYNSYEELKRIKWVKNKSYKYQVKETNFRNVEKALFYKNSGVKIDSSKLKNYQQIISTEGVVASFFYVLVNSKLSSNYQDNSFYRNFLIDPPDDFVAENIFTPLENEYLKIFLVFNKYLMDIKLHQSPLIEFIEGYLCEFPEEKGVIMRLFENVSGHYYTNDIGPEIWVLIKKYKHGIFLFDQFGGNKVNFYSFNLNAADCEDLKSVKDLKNNEIDSILYYREKVTYFDSIEQIELVPGISEKAKFAFKKSSYDIDFVNSHQKQINPYSLYIYGFARVVEKGLFYLMLFITFYYLLLYGKNDVLKVLTVKYVIRKVAKLFILIFLGFASVVLSKEPLQLFLIISVLFIAAEFVLTKREKNRKDAFYTSFFIVIMIMFSVW